jgi:GntR family transcriptional regulator, carbon starvation induced regulator
MISLLRTRSDDDKAATVVGQLAELLRADIISSRLAPDSKLKIEELRQVYGGSAHSLREALTKLAAEGLVEANQQRGFRVASATPQDLGDITRLRAEIECLGLAWSLARGTVTWEGELLAAHHALSCVEAALAAEPTANATAWEDANRAFHQTLMSACGSPRLLAFQARLYEESRRYRLKALAQGEVDLARSRAAHAAIVAAVLARNAPLAKQLLQDHITAGSPNVPQS